MRLSSWNRLEAESSKLEAWLTGSGFVLSLGLQASCLKRISVLADGLMLVFQHPVKPLNYAVSRSADDKTATLFSFDTRVGKT